MEDGAKKVDLTSYPEGMQELARRLKLPIPEENTAQREGMVFGLIASLVRQ